MTPYALTAELLLAAAMSTMFTDINRPTAVVPSSRLAAGDLEMEFVDPDLRAAVQAMDHAAMKLDHYALNQPEGKDVSLAVNTSELLRKRSNELLPSRPEWPAGPGMADVIDMATWRHKA